MVLLLRAFGYVGGHTPLELVTYMASQGFQVWQESGGDFLFVNSGLSDWWLDVDCFTQGL